MEKKVVIDSYYTYGDVYYNWKSEERFEEQKDAVDACIESMKKEYASGYKVSDRLIIRVDYQKIYDELIIISEQTIKTTVEIINAHCAEA